jgi:hypothetical protein
VALAEQEREILEFLLAHQGVTVHYSGRGIGAVMQLSAAPASGSHAAYDAGADHLAAEIGALDALVGYGYIGFGEGDRSVRITDRGRRVLGDAR